MSENLKEEQDKVAPNLFIGKILNDRMLKCEVLDFNGTNISIKVLEIHWDRLGTYLDIGKQYSLFKHEGYNSIQVWEIPYQQMKRRASQVILQWEKDIGWMWDLDS